jgi:hypothetical protein
MCNITYLKPGIEVPTIEIENAASWNDDGHGWAIAAEMGVMLTGRYMDIGTALDTFNLTRKAFPNTHAMFHSRWATHGTVGLSNVHPFSVGKFAAVAHNGILPGKFQPTKGETKSDTAIMAHYWLAGRAQQSGIWTRKERQRIANIIGKGNKLCILSVSPFLPEPKAYLINSSQGTWDHSTGAWFSSDSYTSAYSRRSNGGWLWDYGTDDDEWVKNEHTGVWSRKTSKPADKSCPLCHGSAEHVDRISNVCGRCDSCLDCMEPLRGCMCYYPQEKLAETAHGDEEEMTDAVSIVMSELGGDEIHAD